MRSKTAIATAVLALIALPLTAPIASAQPADGVIHVSASAADGGDGSADKPYKTIAQAVGSADNGSTIEVGDGTYREGEIKTDKSVTIRAAQGASPVLSGAEVPSSWSASGGTWSTSADMVRFCTQCTTNADPSVEGMAAHPEQVFVDGKPLTQVASRGEVNESTFFVEDPDPITLKQPGNNRAGYNAKPHRGASYVIGVDPGRHTVEVVQHSRALTLLGQNTALEGLTVEKYSPVQEWNYSDPEIGGDTGGVMVFASGSGLKITGNSFRYSGGGAALGLSGADKATVLNNRITDNAGVGVGVNRSNDFKVENNFWSNNNTAGFDTTHCGGYCTIADMKVTHSEKMRYAFNTVDYSQAGVDRSTVASWNENRQSAIWLDEGVLNSTIVASHFVNVPMAIFTEVSRDNTIASNIVEGAGIGIQVAGSENTQVWNNTITHALTSISVYEDERSDGCNARNDDGSCALTESWSASRGLKWDTVGTKIYNNILSSEQTVTDGDQWKYAAMVQVTGAKNADGSGAVYANDMVSAIDYNVYYRQDTGAPSTTVLWQYGENRGSDSVNAASLSDFSSSSRVTVTGKESNGLDLKGSREDNPVLVKESADPTAWKTSDLHVAPGGPAAGSGTALPQDVAGALGVGAGSAVDRGALVNAAWQETTPTGPAAQAQGGDAATAQATAGAQPAAAASPAPTAAGAAATQAAGGAASAQAAAGEAPSSPEVLGASQIDGVQAVAAGGDIDQAQRPALGARLSHVQKVVGGSAAGLGVLATIVGVVLHALRIRLF